MVGCSRVGLVVERLSGCTRSRTWSRSSAFSRPTPGSDLGIGTGRDDHPLRTLGMVTAGCATAAGILGYHVLRRNRSARVAVTCSPSALLRGLATDGFITSWSRPPPRSCGSSPRGRGSTAPPRRSAERRAGRRSRRRAGCPRRLRPVAPPVDAGSGPAAVLWACVLTWICTAAVSRRLAASAVALAVSPDLMLDEVHRQNPDLAGQGVTDDVLMAVTYVIISGLARLVPCRRRLAVLVFRRVAWARIALIVSALSAPRSVFRRRVRRVRAAPPAAAERLCDRDAGAAGHPALVRPFTYFLTCSVRS